MQLSAVNQEWWFQHLVIAHILRTVNRSHCENCYSLSAVRMITVNELFHFSSIHSQARVTQLTSQSSASMIVVHYADVRTKEFLRVSAVPRWRKSAVHFLGLPAFPADNERIEGGDENGGGWQGERGAGNE